MVGGGEIVDGRVTAAGGVGIDGAANDVDGTFWLLRLSCSRGSAYEFTTLVSSEHTDDGAAVELRALVLLAPPVAVDSGTSSVSTLSGRR